MAITKQDIKKALTKMPTDQREMLEAITDDEMLGGLAELRSEEVMDYVNQSLVNLIIEEIRPAIHDVIHNYLGWLEECYNPFLEFREIVLREKQSECGDGDEEPR